MKRLSSMYETGFCPQGYVKQAQLIYDHFDMYFVMFSALVLFSQIVKGVS